MDIGSKLKFLRDFYKKKQKDIADFLDIKINTYSQYENNVRTPSLGTLYDLCDYYEISFSYFAEDYRFIDEEESGYDEYDAEREHGIYLLNKYTQSIIEATRIMKNIDKLDLSLSGDYDLKHHYIKELGKLHSKITRLEEEMEHFIPIGNILDEIETYIYEP